MSAQVQEVQWSDLQRDPKSVAELAEAGDVRVRRRDGVNLLLIREDRIASAGAGAVTAARALRTLSMHLSAEDLVDALLDEFPWLHYLPVVEVKQFCLDFVQAAMAAAELAQWEILEQTVLEWKATAAVHAHPVLSQELRKPITGDFGPVPSPIEQE